MKFKNKIKAIIYIYVGKGPIVIITGDRYNNYIINIANFN